MSILTLIIIVSSVLFIFLAFDLYHRKKLTFLHFAVFWGGAAVLILFSIKPSTLDQFGWFFGIARGADAVVYSTIIFLVYLFFSVLNKQTKQEYLLSKLTTQHAIKEREPNQRKPNTDKYGFLIRAYNEEKSIEKVIDSILKRWFHNIIITNDGSSDQTEKKLIHLRKNHREQNIVILNHLINRWAGAANKTLFTFAQKHWDNLGIDRWVTFDADDQMDIEDIEKFQHIAKTQKYDMILWSRFVQWGEAKDIPKIRKIILWWSRIITHILNGVKTTDPHNGYRMISNKAIKKIHIESDGMTYASELIDQINEHKLSYTEVGVWIKYTNHTLKKGQKNSNAFKILREIIYKKMFYK